MTTARKILLNAFEYLLISLCMVCALIVLGSFGAMEQGNISDGQALLQIVAGGIACFLNGRWAYAVERRLKNENKRNH